MPTIGLNSLMRYFIIVLFFLLEIISAIAQENVDIEKLKLSYPGYNAVCLLKKEHAIIKLNGNTISVLSETNEDICMIGDKYDSYSEKKIFYSSFEKLKKISAKTLIPKPNGKGYNTIKATSIIDVNNISRGSFYDDSKAKKILFPALQVGARTVLNYTTELNEPRFFGIFYFNLYMPVDESEFSVDFPKEVTVNYKLFNTDSANIVTEKKTNGDYTTYSWKLKHLREYITEADGPNIAYTAPHIVVYIKEYQLDKQTVTLTSSPNDLYGWYYSLTKNINKTLSATLKSIVDSLVVNQNNELEKVKNIFYWVEDNINYVAFEDSLSGYIPREASSICEKKYGDCKDMASIITSMLNYAGIKSYLTWIGTRDIPYRYTDVPLSFADNHMIATYINNGEYFFLDATGKYQPLDLPTDMIQGKEALIGKGENDFEIVKVPEINAETNKIVDSCKISIDGKKIIGEEKYIATGYNKIKLLYNLKYMKEQEQANFFNHLSAKGNNKMNIDSLVINGLKNRDSELTALLKFNTPDYIIHNNNSIYINLSLNKYLPGLTIDLETRKSDIVIDFKNKHIDYTELTIPKEYKIDFLPENVSYINDKFKFKIDYVLKNNKICQTNNIYINTLLIKKGDFIEWNKFIKALSKAYNETIILTKK